MLVDHQIREACSQGIVQNYEQKLIRSNSLDFRLGKYIKIERSPVDPDWVNEAIALQQISIQQGFKSPHPQYAELQKLMKRGVFEEVDLSNTSQWNPYPLPPKSFILAATIEYLNISNGMTIDIVLRSTSARKGINHSLAGLCDSGYQGCPTLELSNLLQWHPVEIWYGMEIGQFLFHENATPEKSYAESSGNYQYQTEPTEAKQ